MNELLIALVMVSVSSLLTMARWGHRRRLAAARTR